MASRTAMPDYSFTCPLPHGIHARPASALEEIARPFESRITLLNERTRRSADAKSILAIVSADIRQGDRCVLSVAGADQQQAFAALTTFLETGLPHSDDLLPEAPTAGGAVVLPPVLARAGSSVLTGIGIVPGVGEGGAVLVGAFVVPDAAPKGGAIDAEDEARRMDEALGRLIASFEARLERSAGVEAAIVRAHRSVARDPEFAKRLHWNIRELGATGAGAITDTRAHFSSMLEATGSALLRERALDIRDVCAQLLQALYGDIVRASVPRLDTASVCIADSLTPGDFLALDRRYLAGLALAHGTATSHTVILARSFGIPTVVGLPAADTARMAGQPVIVDGDLGLLVGDLTDRARRYYVLERRRLEGRGARERRFAEAPAHTEDGRRIEIGANIGTDAEAVPAFAAGAEGIGLFRTEMLFVDRAMPPSEDEQFECYRQVLAAAGNRSVIIRTLDVGGDKPIPYLHLPPEDNPFLGCRAVRLYPDFERIFRAQVAALVRASAFGRLRVMVPMVSQVEEARWVRSIVVDEQARCAAAGVPYDARMELGAMIEIPSVAFLLEPLARELDFFSIGSNDLLQYFAAVDRTNRRVAALYDPAQPAFLRLLAQIVDGAHEAGRWIGLCGEMGGQPRYLPLLVGTGLDEISMAAPLVAPAKAALAQLSYTACATLFARARGCATIAEVHDLLAQFESSRPAPLLEPDLVVVDADGRTKEEAIKQAVDQLFIAGRTDAPRSIEEAVWRREAVYSTGFGYGFAIPHCKTDAVHANSLAVLKLRTPVEWGSLDDKPVGVVLLLAIRESDGGTEHMKVLASLARKVMHEEFREHLLRERDARALCDFLHSTDSRVR